MAQSTATKWTLTGTVLIACNCDYGCPDLEMRLSGAWKILYPILARRRKRDREWGVNNVKRVLEAQTGTGS